MPLSDLLLVIKWDLVLFAIGVLFLPLCSKIFFNFWDKGYIFSRILGIAITAYIVFLLGILRAVSFTRFECSVLLVFLFFAQIVYFSVYRKINLADFLSSLKEKWLLFFSEEVIFFLLLLFWTYVRAHQPDIHGLEKYMDFGFVNSILRSTYFPPRDIWFTPLSINYYYFGHLATAVLTKISNIPSFITYNLMIATIAALCFTQAFSIGLNLWFFLRKSKRTGFFSKQGFISGFLTAFLLSFAGNFETVYSLFVGYSSNNPLPFWQMPFSLATFPNGYWYPNATRFIYHTIHEFPIYSFVVSDLHGHVLDIPFVLLTIAILLSLISKSQIRNPKQIRDHNNQNFKQFGILNFDNCSLFRNSILDIRILLLGFMLAVMYMTNAWDGAIYAFFALLVFTYLAYKTKKYSLYTVEYLLIIILFMLFALPFSRNFAPFVSGIGIICAPSFLTHIGRLGPILFEKNYCERSPVWQLFILYGFFYFWVLSFLVVIYKKFRRVNRYTSDLFVLFLIGISTLLIIAPEFIYLKDIYTGYFRANTMFKLVYQAFIMLSIAVGYIITRMVSDIKSRTGILGWKLLYLLIGFIGLCLVSIYPYFAINSYYGNLKVYHGLDGISYLNNLYPTDYKAVQWLNANVKGQPVLLEAQGDSYTDYARVSANTGLPTVLGWTVHEWLWRGTYNIPAARIPDVRNLYETDNLKLTKNLLEKYNIRYIFIGDLERRKYPDLEAGKFSLLGKLVFKDAKTEIYKISVS